MYLGTVTGYKMAESPIRQFLGLPKAELADMDDASLRGECEGWRTLYEQLPQEVAEWMARLFEVIRFQGRDYKAHTGLLLGVRFDVSEFTVGVEEVSYDSLTGGRVLERKTLTMPQKAVMFHESIEDAQPYDPVADDKQLSTQKIG